MYQTPRCPLANEAFIGSGSCPETWRAGRSDSNLLYFAASCFTTVFRDSSYLVGKRSWHWVKLADFSHFVKEPSTFWGFPSQKQFKHGYCFLSPWLDPVPPNCPSPRGQASAFQAQQPTPRMKSLKILTSIEFSIAMWQIAGQPFWALYIHDFIRRFATTRASQFMPVPSLLLIHGRPK